MVPHNFLMDHYNQKIFLIIILYLFFPITNIFVPGYLGIMVTRQQHFCCIYAATKDKLDYFLKKLFHSSISHTYHHNSSLFLNMHKNIRFSNMQEKKFELFQLLNFSYVLFKRIHLGGLKQLFQCITVQFGTSSILNAS